jgi:hypothetical protein
LSNEIENKYPDIGLGIWQEKEASMTLPLDLEETTFSRVQREAERLGIEPQEVVKRLVEQAFPTQPNLTSEQQLKIWEEHMATRPDNEPLLSDYAISRESFYEHERLR